MSQSAPVTVIDTRELALRIAEACMGCNRPRGKSAESAMAELRELDPEATRGFERAALAAAEYIAECCNAGDPGQVQVQRVNVRGTEAIQ